MDRVFEYRYELSSGSGSITGWAAEYQGAVYPFVYESSAAEALAAWQSGEDTLFGYEAAVNPESFVPTGKVR